MQTNDSFYVTVEALKKLHHAGLTIEIVRKIASGDETRAKRIVSSMRNGGFSETTTPQRAAEIMEDHFFGVGHAITVLGLSEVLSEAFRGRDVPFNEEVLSSVKETHILVASMPSSILEIRKKHPSLFSEGENAWYENASFARVRGDIGWHLVRLSAVEGSLREEEGVQKGLVRKEEDIPRARTRVYALVAYYHRHKKCPPCQDMLRTNSYAGNDAVAVSTREKKINLSYVGDQQIGNRLGIASEWRALMPLCS